MTLQLSSESRSRYREIALAALARWRDPVVFSTEVLRTPLWLRQREMVQAIATCPRVAVRSGHKVGKSTSIAVTALWWLLTKPRARVIFTAASYRQVEGILYKEAKRLYSRSRWPLGPTPSEVPERGIRFRDGRELIGFSTKEPERMAGFSGPNMLFLIDEASGVPDAIFQAIEGNLAGGAHVAMISNPTQTSGFYYEAFTKERSTWRTIHISSVECAEIAPGELGTGTGLATKAWCDEKLAEWGPDDSRYHVRVLGQFPKQDERAMISVWLVEQAVSRWTKDAPSEGPTTIGVDVARFGNDCSVIIWSRGKWSSTPITLKGYDGVNVAGVVSDLARKIARPGERVSVRVDVTGMGCGVADPLRRNEEIDLVEVDAANSSTIEGYSRKRDEVWGSLEAWLKEGGAIPGDRRLEEDLTSPMREWDVRGRLKVESKHELRKRIGRSTDVADALALAVYRGPESNAEAVFGMKVNMPKARFDEPRTDDGSPVWSEHYLPESAFEDQD